MARGQLGASLVPIRRLFEGRSAASASEWQLLRRYLEARDEVAFGAIVARHGPMVLGVCRRVLADPVDAEDAFQATFLVLARKGGTLGEGDPLGGWLHGVAYRVALRARASAARRRKLERSATPSEFAPADDPARLDLPGVIDQELARLPERYRAPLILCYLDGLTHEEAARQLGWPLGSVKGRLGRARDLLRGRLERRGVAPGALLVAEGLRPAVGARLVELATRAAMAGHAAGTVPASVVSLAAGSLTTMLMNKLKALGMMALVLGGGAAVMAYQFGGQGGPIVGNVPMGGGGVGGGAGQPTFVAQGPPMGGGMGAQPQGIAQDPPIRVSEWVAGWPDLTKPIEPDPKTKAILDALEEPLAMKFPQETPFEDVKKYIQEATKRASLPNGIPIYVDPVGLQEAKKTISSTIAIDLDEIPLKITLRLVLKQIGLIYLVRDGLLTVTSEASDDPALTPFSIMREKAEKGLLTREQYLQLIEALKMKGQVEQLTRRGLGGGGGGGGGGFQ